MEILSNLSKVTQKPARRCGRGIGSGLGGHTSGRGRWHGRTSGRLHSQQTGRGDHHTGLPQPDHRPQ